MANGCAGGRGSGCFGGPFSDGCNCALARSDSAATGMSCAATGISCAAVGTDDGITLGTGDGALTLASTGDGTGSGSGTGTVSGTDTAAGIENDA